MEIGILRNILRLENYKFLENVPRIFINFPRKAQHTTNKYNFNKIQCFYLLYCQSALFLPLLSPLSSGGWGGTTMLSQSPGRQNLGMPGRQIQFVFPTKCFFQMPANRERGVPGGAEVGGAANAQWVWQMKRNYVKAEAVQKATCKKNTTQKKEENVTGIYLFLARFVSLYSGACIFFYYY